MKDLTEREKRILLSLVRKERVVIRLSVAGAREIAESGNYMSELNDLRAKLKE